MQLEESRQLVQPELQAVDQLIHLTLNSDVSLAQQVAEYIVASGGKRIRPLLALLSAKAFNYQGENHIKLAAIIELLHTATLLHDDVVDESQLRRGRSTANAKWGNQASVLVGDLLYARSFQLIVDINNPTITQRIADATSVIIEGEVLQLMNSHDPTISENAYLEVLIRKTGKLFEVSALCGPLLINADTAEITALEKYGLNLGVAFQLIDDALDYTASTELLGKNIGDDLAEGKITLPLLYVLQHGNSQQIAIVQDALRQGGTSQIAAIQTAIAETGGITYTQRLAKHYADQAIAALQNIPTSAALSALKGLAEFAVARGY